MISHFRVHIFLLSFFQFPVGGPTIRAREIRSIFKAQPAIFCEQTIPGACFAISEKKVLVYEVSIKNGKKMSGANI